jgi:WhiB family transcriptional regulator, redox-sensing transcriptional regulator
VTVAMAAQAPGAPDGPESTVTAPFPGRDWRALAACRTANPEIFFRRRAALAIAWCTGCAVRPECLRFALANRIRHGVFGGLTGCERSAVLRRERSAA